MVKKLLTVKKILCSELGPHKINQNTKYWRKLIFSTCTYTWIIKCFTNSKRDIMIRSMQQHRIRHLSNVHQIFFFEEFVCKLLSHFFCLFWPIHCSISHCHNLFNNFPMRINLQKSLWKRSLSGSSMCQCLASLLQQNRLNRLFHCPMCICLYRVEGHQGMALHSNLYWGNATCPSHAWENS